MMGDENTLWMGDIEPWMTESIIINSFQYFNIYPINVKLIKDKKKKINRTYCFVKFKNIEDVNNALINLNGKKLPSCNINFKLNWADYNSNNITKIIYVGNLNMNITDNDLYKLFSQKYKSVHHAKVICENGISKGYGFVVFKNEEEYFRCLKEMNGYNYYGNKIKVREKRKNDDNENKNKEKYYNKSNILLNNNSNNDINSSLLYLNNTQNINLNNNNSIPNPNLINNMILSNLPNNNLNNNNIITNINSMKNLTNNKNNSINLNKKDNHNMSKNNQINNNLNNINQQLPINLLLNKMNSSMNIFNQNNNTLIKENNQKEIIPNSSNYIKNETINGKTNKNEQNKGGKNNNKNKLKLEVLDNIDDLTLNKKIHESILKTFEFYKKLFISSGTKFKSK